MSKRMAMIGMPASPWTGRLRVGAALAVAAVHGLALFAPWTATRAGVLCWAVPPLATGQCGIHLEFHRLLAHQSFRTPCPVEYGLALLGTLAMQTGPVSWVGMHRRHHAEAETPLDPHTPRAGLLWAPFLWVFHSRTGVTENEAKPRLARDLARDPFYRFLERHHRILNTASLVVLLGLGMLGGGWRPGWSVLVWGDSSALSASGTRRSLSNR